MKWSERAKSSTNFERAMRRRIRMTLEDVLAKVFQLPPTSAGTGLMQGQQRMHTRPDLASATWKIHRKDFNLLSQTSQPPTKP